MSRAYIALILAVAVIIVGAVWYTRTPEESTSTQGGTFGSYPYTCDQNVQFVMTPSEDMGTITVEPVEGMAYPSASILADSPTDSGRRFKSGAFEFHGKGETVTLYDVAADKSYTCSPLPNPDEPPFNFGD